MTLRLSYGGLHKVISGGQTGADQGGLLAAWRMGVETGGQAPLHYKVQNGYNALLEAFGLKADGDYADRTRANTQNSDATVIIVHNPTSPGTRVTMTACRNAGKPMLIINVFEVVRSLAMGPIEGQIQKNAVTMCSEHANSLHKFLVDHQVGVLNVAGNREIQSSGGNGAQSVQVMTSITDTIVTIALEMLSLEDKLVYKVDAL